MGRPLGAKTIQRDIVTSPISRCRKCGSTVRTSYTDRRALASNGTHDGQPYSAVVWRTCHCKTCGQARTDKSYEYRPRTQDVVDREDVVSCADDQAEVADGVDREDVVSCADDQAEGTDGE